MIGRISLTTFVLLSLGLSSAYAQANDASKNAVPGLILIKGGKTTVGSTLDEVMPFILDEPGFVNMFAGELPQHVAEVDDFYLMPTEVTNEQYAAFVKAGSGSIKPPFTWGKATTEEARKAHLDAEGSKKKAARDKGEQYNIVIFDDSDWWDSNWMGKEWAIPAGDETKPVCRVSYYDAEAYAAWAGLRLMTEQEFQRAARGDSKRKYPWDGDKFIIDACNSLRYTGVDGLMEVGSFEKGANQGIYDLVGNALEWTSSKYQPFPGYKPLNTKDKRGTPLEGLAPFDVEKRVLVGGYFGLTENGCRVSSRTPTTRRQATDGVGFRCAADIKSGRSAAEFVIKNQVRINVLRGERPRFDATNTAILEHYTSEAGSSKVAGYAVITGYDRSLFAAVESIQVSNTGDLKELSESTPVYLGLLSFNHPLAKPALDGGTYFVAWRSGGTIQGESRKIIAAREKGEKLEEDDGATRYWELKDFDEKEDCFVIFNLAGEPILILPGNRPTVKNLGSNCSMSFVAYDAVLNPKAREKTDELIIDIRIPGKRQNKGFVGSLSLRVEPGYITSDWR